MGAGTFANASIQLRRALLLPLQQRRRQPSGQATLVQGAEAPQPAHAHELEADEPTGAAMVVPCPRATPLPQGPFRRQDPRQEPSAVVPHAGICSGAVRKGGPYRDHSSFTLGSHALPNVDARVARGTYEMTPLSARWSSAPLLTLYHRGKPPMRSSQAGVVSSPATS
jgi:hypothetical protein